MPQFNAIWLPDGFASERPVSPGKGRYLFRATDTGAISYWDGSAWRAVRDSATNATQLQGRDVASDAPTNGQVLLWDAGQSRWEPGTVSSGGPTTETYDFSGGAHDYTADANYAPSGSTSTVRSNSESALLGDGVSVPYFHVVGRDYVAALARTTTPSLRITILNANGEQLLRGDGTTELGGNVVFPVPWWAVTIPRWQIDAVVATNIAATPCTSGSDFASCRVGLVRWHPSDGIPQTVCVVDNYSYAGDASGTQKEGRTMDGASDTATDISGETSGGINVRHIRIVRSGTMLTLSTGPNEGALTERRKLLHYKRRIGPVGPVAFVLAMGQVKATPSSGCYGELRSLVFTPG